MSATHASTLPVRNPRTGLIDDTLRITSRAEIAAAAADLRRAQRDWQALGAEGRGVALAELSRAFTQHAAALQAALAEDTGRERIAHIETGAVRGMIHLGLQHARDVFRTPEWRASSIPGIVGRERHTAYPLVGVIAPWNFPLILSMIDTLPALLAGAAVILKPSEVTPRYTRPLQQILDSVPAIAAVTRIVQGPGSTGAELIEEVDAVVCTGSVRTGRLVAEHAARRFIPAFLELGGKDPLIVTQDADLDRAARVILRASLLATGQACQSLERVYVDRRVLPEVLARLQHSIRGITLTCDDPAGHIGPFIMAKQADIVREHIADALEHGATLEHGGHIIERGGLWCEPTLLTGVNHRMRVMREETFGPVIAMMGYETIDEAVSLANDSDYGLSANVIAGSEQQALAIAERLEAGFISINDASLSSMISDFEWEGFRFSGLGRSRMGPSGIARYLRTQAIVINRGPTGDLASMTDAQP
jgi:acyl-CoA reductase-like NAD-dependent aldehyde dehydrogenase